MAQTETEIVQGIGSDYAIKYGFSVTEDYFFKSGRGLSHELVDAISSHKSEPDWIRKFRHKSLDYFLARPMPTWGGMPSLHEIDFDSIFYYIKPTENQADSWADLPADIKDTWDKLGIPEAEKKYLAGVGAQYESEVVYHKLQEDLDALLLAAREAVVEIPRRELATHLEPVHLGEELLAELGDRDRIVESGGPELADKLEEHGYKEWGEGDADFSQNGHAPHGKDA